MKDKFGVVVEKRERLGENPETGEDLIQYKLVFVVDLDDVVTIEQPTMITIRSCDKEFYDCFELNKKYNMTFALKNVEPVIRPKKDLQ